MMVKLCELNRKELVFSVQPLCSLCLCGVCFCSEFINHRDTENTEVAQRSGRLLIDVEYQVIDCCYVAPVLLFELAPVFL